MREKKESGKRNRLATVPLPGQLCKRTTNICYFTIIVKQSFTSLEYPSFLKFNEIT